jgi:hypothetical protein
MSLPAFVGGMPGGMELFVIFGILLSLLIPVALVALALQYLRNGSGDSDLERRVANLEGQVEALREELRERD